MEPTAAVDCEDCGNREDGGKCARCGAIPGFHPRDSLISYAGILDTKSFIIPMRKRAIWIWVGVGILIPLVMSGAAFAVQMLKK